MCFTGALGSAALTDPAALSAISCVEHSLTTYLLMYQVKPSSNQVNLASCCVMPPDLTAFAKEFDIQLLTHNDPKGEIPFISFRCQLDGVYRCERVCNRSASVPDQMFSEFIQTFTDMLIFLLLSTNSKTRPKPTMC